MGGQASPNRGRVAVPRALSARSEVDFFLPLFFFLFRFMSNSMLVIDGTSPSESAVVKWVLWASSFTVACLHAACVVRPAGLARDPRCPGRPTVFAGDLNYPACVLLPVRFWVERLWVNLSG